MITFSLCTVELQNLAPCYNLKNLIHNMFRLCFYTLKYLIKCWYKNTSLFNKTNCVMVKVPHLLYQVGER